MFLIGCHLSITDGYTAFGETITELGGNTFQYFTKNPRGRSAPKYRPESDIMGLNRMIDEGVVLSPIAHAPFTYNPCSNKPEIVEYTTDSMKQELIQLENIHNSLYNFHPGCHLNQGTEYGIKKIAEMLNSIMWEDMHTTVLLETMAGKGSEIGRSFDEIKAIIDLVDVKFRDKIGVTLDTCHVFDAGYDIVNDLDGVIKEFDSVIGINRLKAIHLNDSKNPIGSHKDRHEKIGEGFIGLEAISNIINHEALRDLPFCLETPNENEGYQKEIAILKGLRKE